MKRTKKPEVEGIGTIWLNCPYTEVALELKDALLNAGVRVHDGRKPPVEEAPSAVVLFTNGADLDSEVGRLRVLATHTPVLVCGSCGEPQIARSALKAGASGFVNIDIPPRHFLQALSLVSRGEIVLSREIVVDLLGEGLFSKMPKILDSECV